MKALVISDVHSNIYALEAIWRKESDCDVVYCAGDILEYGVYPKETLSWLQERQAICVIGNHDKSVIDCFRSQEHLTQAPHTWSWGHHHAHILSEAEVQFLEQLPEDVHFTLDGWTYGMTHHHKPSYRNRDYSIIDNEPEFDQVLEMKYPGMEKSISRLILGHTHRRVMMSLTENKLWLNPGSTSYRRKDDLSQEAHYITITDGKIRLQQTNYDVVPMYTEIKKLEGLLSSKAYEDTMFYFGPRNY